MLRNVGSVSEVNYGIVENPWAGYAFFSNAYRTFPRISYRLGHKTHLKKQIKIIQSIFLIKNKMKLEINNKSMWRITNIWKLNNLLLNNQ